MIPAGLSKQPERRSGSRPAWLDMCRQLRRAPLDLETHRRCRQRILSLGPAQAFSAAGLGHSAESVVETLVTGGLIDPSTISAYVVRVLRHRYGIDDELAAGQVRGDFQRIADDALLMAALVAGPVPDFHLEAFFVHLCRTLLERHLRQGRLAPAELKVAVALARQAFSREYLAEQSSEDRHSIAALVAMCFAADEPSNRFVLSHSLAIIAAHRPLYTLDVAESLAKRALSTWPSVVQPLIREQILEPRAEAGARAHLEVVTPVVRAGSRRVAAHYEDHPFPRWSRLYPCAVNSSHEPGPTQTQRALELILVPGCGSGRHALELALRHPRSRVWAVDLSRASLAHGQRVARELRVANVRFMLGDLLELPRRVRARFDHIDCVGVLHHLEERRAGWAALRELLVPGGTLRVAVYGRLARLPVEFLRADIVRLGLRPVEADMKAFRRRLSREPRYQTMRELFVATPWHNLSEFRDTLFHECEHRYRLAELRRRVADAELELVRFQLPTLEMAQRYRQRHPDDPEFRSWDHWLAFEREYIGTMAMFDLCVRRPA